MTKILIVDDRENNLIVLENVLNCLDVEIVKATTGNDALRATLNHEFALAILDVQMPEMDGYELAGLMRSDARTRNIPIIFMSAIYLDDAYIFKGYESGAVDFITKPFNSKVLLSKVRVFLELNEQKAQLVGQRARLESLVSDLEVQIEVRRQAELEVDRKSRLLEGINRVLRQSILCETEEDLAKTCLSVAEELTGSSFGFIGEIDDEGLFYDIALSDPGWAACGMPKSDAVLLVHNMEIRGIWGRVLKDEKSLIANQTDSHPDSIGVPEGHPPVRSFMGVPLKNADGTFGMIALANKDGGYGEVDAQTIESLSVAFVEALARKRTQDLLRKSHDELEVRVRDRTAELARANEAQRVYVTKLEQNNRELEDFAFVASHDLQEPLRKIRTFADLLKDSYGQFLDERGLDYLERIDRASIRMQELIFDLRKYSRVAGRPEPFAIIDLREPVREAVAELSELIEETGGDIVVGELPSIEADRDQMRLLFQNLIGNALKYRSGLPPKVDVYCSSSCPDGFREIHVKDNGIGFDECFLDKIFRPFQRLHGRKSPYSGTGMGLALCRRIVERHGGAITARSEPGKGTTMIVKLPGRQPEWSVYIEKL